MNCDKSALIAYIYGECDANEREAFEQHLSLCGECRAEVANLGELRATMREWTPPEAKLGFRVVREEEINAAPGLEPAGRTNVLNWRQRIVHGAIPAWAKAAAAVLLFAAGLGISNLHVTFANGAMTVSTGWTAASPTAGPSTRPNMALAQGTAPSDIEGRWRADLAAVEQNLRREIAAAQSSSPQQVAAVSGKPSQAETSQLIRTVQSMIDESERRQQQATEHLMATRFVQFGRDIASQRRADLITFQQGLGQVEGRTTSEVAQLREVQRYLMRVANIQEIK